MSDSTQPSSPAGVHGQHWVRYGIAADQKYLLGDFLDSYDQLVINGNMLAHMQSALSQFITQQLRKPFIIDPQTHAFAHDLEHLISSSKGSAGKIKRSWAKLIDTYGPGLKRIIEEEGRPLDPSDLDDSAFRMEFTEKVLCFQRDAVQRELKEGEDREYLEFLKEETGVDPFLQPPAILIAPYFFIGGPFASEWAERNVDLLQYARTWLDEQSNPQPPLAGQLVISKEILADEGERKQTVENYIGANPDLILLWIDQFSEHNATKHELEHLLDLFETFHESGLPVVNLFGGFFSVATMRFSEKLNGALAAVCHGLEYGETRPVIPLGGGTPVARFYSRTLHHRLPPRIALREIDELGGLASVEDYHSAICDCPNCRKVITSDPLIPLNENYFDSKETAYWVSGRRVARDFPTAVASENCTRHYMWCKAWEYGELNTSLADLKSRLRSADHRLRKTLGTEYAGHPKIWAEALR